MHPDQNVARGVRGIKPKAERVRLRDDRSGRQILSDYAIQCCAGLRTNHVQRTIARMDKLAADRCVCVVRLDRPRVRQGRVFVER